MNVCIWEGCESEVKTRSLCRKHYQIAWKSGIHDQFDKKPNQYPTHCLFEGCNRKHKSLGYCNAHYQQIYRGASPTALERIIKCSHENCERPHRAKGLCDLHYKRKRNNQEMDAPLRGTFIKKCSIEGCNRKHCSKGFCGLHYGRYLSGYPMDKPIKKSGRVRNLSQINWSKNKRGYIVGRFQGKVVIQHRFFWELHHGRKLQPFENIHHKNGIRDDNRIENLELWTKPQPCGQRPEDLVAWVLEYYREEVLRQIDIRIELPL